MPGFLSPGKGVPLLLIPEYSGINNGQRVPDRSQTTHWKPLVKWCFLTFSKISDTELRIQSAYKDFKDNLIWCFLDYYYFILCFLITTQPEPSVTVASSASTLLSGVFFSVLLMITADCVGIDTNLDDKRGVSVGKQNGRWESKGSLA